MLPLKSLVSLLAGLVLAGSALADCGGYVTIGEGATQVTTGVANKAVDGACLNDLIVDTEDEGANYGNHGEFVAALEKLVTNWRKDGVVTAGEAEALLEAGAGSDVDRKSVV